MTNFLGYLLSLKKTDFGKRNINFVSTLNFQPRQCFYEYASFVPMSQYSNYVKICRNPFANLYLSWKNLNILFSWADTVCFYPEKRVVFQSVLLLIFFYFFINLMILKTLWNSLQICILSLKILEFVVTWPGKNKKIALESTGRLYKNKNIRSKLE